MFRAQTRSLRVLVAAGEFTFGAFGPVSNTTATLNNTIVAIRNRTGGLHYLVFRTLGVEVRAHGRKWKLGVRFVVHDVSVVDYFTNTNEC